MKVTIINKSDSTGGAAIVSRRLTEALRAAGIEASMLVAEKLSDFPWVTQAASPKREKIPFLAERLKIFIHNGFNRSDLFKVDTASDGLPLWNHPLVKEADVICLNWVNQGFLALKGVERILQTGKPVVWTMHDMWNMTGICHHAGHCLNWEKECGNCRFLGSKSSPRDISHKVWLRKHAICEKATSSSSVKLHFVAVSNWLAQLARRSSLLSSASLSVIPNAFPLPPAPPGHAPHDKFRIVMGAARLDDPIKGLPILVKATQLLKQLHPDEARRMELITFGAVRNQEALDGIGIAHRHLGMLHGESNIRRVYLNSDAVVSASLYETLPGTLVEGLAYGCIPVSFNRGGQSDIVTHLDTGYIAEFDPDITTAASNLCNGILWSFNHADEDMRIKMYNSALKKFDSQVIAGEYIKLFSHLLEQG